MKRLELFISLAVAVALITSCGAAEPVVVEKEVTKVVQETIVETVVIKGTPETVEKQVTRVVEVEKVITTTPEPELGPAVGGTLYYVLGGDPDTLDPQLSTGGSMYQVSQFLGASLIAKDPETGEYIPYLAESWSVADDGLSYEFKLKENIRFHDGTPLTAHDFVWTFERAMDPATMSAATAAMLQGVIGAEAVDDYNLRLNTAWANYYLLENLTDPVFFQPMSQAYVEQAGEQYGRQPLGVGPFKFKEWVTDEKIVLERNPDFAWGPGGTRGGPPYIENLEFRIVPEYATRVAGLEAGEIDYAQLEVRDVEHIEATGQFQIFSALRRGIGPMVLLNVSQPPFDDVRVRQAFNLALDREALIKVVLLGQAIPQYGPISPSVQGYWPGVEYIGYNYDPDKARALLTEAGYVQGSDGVWEKDGQPLAVVLKVPSDSPGHVKLAPVLQQQLKELGVDVELELVEFGVLDPLYSQGAYDFGLINYTYSNSGLLYAMYHSRMVGSLNSSQVSNPELDKILETMGFTTDPEVNQKAADEAQRFIVEQAYIIPLYTPKIPYVMNNRVKDAVFSPITGMLDLFDAYIETE